MISRCVINSGFKIHWKNPRDTFVKIHLHSLSYISFKVLINCFHLKWEYWTSNWDLEPSFPSPFCKIIPFWWTTLVRRVAQSRRKYSPAAVFSSPTTSCLSLAISCIHDTRKGSPSLVQTLFAAVFLLMEHFNKVLLEFAVFHFEFLKLTVRWK